MLSQLRAAHAQPAGTVNAFQLKIMEDRFRVT